MSYEKFWLGFKYEQKADWKAFSNEEILNFASY